MCDSPKTLLGEQRVWILDASIVTLQLGEDSELCTKVYPPSPHHYLFVLKEVVSVAVAVGTVGSLFSLATLMK